MIYLNVENIEGGIYMNKDRLVNQFLDFVKIPSPSGKEGKFSLVLKEEMEKMGFEVVVDREAGVRANSDAGNLIGYLKGNREGVEPIMFCAHMDTVTPCENIEPVIGEDGVIRSKGDTILSGDDKGGIVAILEGIRHLQENNIPHGDIEVVFTIYEEGGLFGAKYLDYSLIKSKMAFILDSGGPVGGVVVQGPAQSQIKAKFHGKAAHAGLSPEKGISAIQVASRAIDGMNLLRIDEETTANIGTIKGGAATNIVADYTEVEFEARSLNQDKLDTQVQHMVDTIEKAATDFGAKVDLDVHLNYPSFKLELDEPVLKVVEKAMNKMNLEYDPMSTGGGSDTNIFNGNGVKAVTLAIGMYNAHGVDEYISIEDLVKSAELVVSIAESI